MNGLEWTLLVISQLGLVVGQTLLKKGMATEGPAVLLNRALKFWVFVAGVVCLTVWFQLWVGLMHRVPLSQLMPLEGLCPLLIALAGICFLGEHFTWRGWLGIILTSIGVILVSAS